MVSKGARPHSQKEEKAVKPETWVAIYAAIIGTSAFLLNLKAWVDSGVKLKLELMPDGMTIGGGPDLDESDLIILYVTNRGDAPTMVTNMVLFEITSCWQLFLFNITSSMSWRRWKVYPKRSFVITQPQLKGYPPNIPSALESSKKWTGAIRPRSDVITDMHTGSYYTGIYVSSRNRPYLIRIPTRTTNLPEGTVAWNTPG
jgi:hypothetical protein